jgi:hypothetical protein
MVPINNRLDEDELEGTGLDAAVDALTMGLKGTGPTSVFDHPEKRRKVRGAFNSLRWLKNSLSS